MIFRGKFSSLYRHLHRSAQFIGRRSWLIGILSVLTVAGALAAVNYVKIETQGAYRIILANGIPNHPTGRFPNAHNPNTISAQNYHFRVAVNPRKASRTTRLNMQDFGIALNGVPFDPFTAEFWRRDRSSGWNYAAMTGKTDLGLDMNHAHVQPNGAYHYHGLPTDLVKGDNPSRHSSLLGYSADGFPIYGLYGFANPKSPSSGIKKLSSSYRLKKGTRPGGSSGPGGTYDGTFVQDFEYVAGLGDLDVCNGRDTVTPDYPTGTYAYFITQSYPFIPRCYRGSPDSSFERGMAGGLGPPGGGRGGRLGPPPGGSPPPGGRPPPRRSALSHELVLRRRSRSSLA